jgi:hypothetical protein
MYWGPENLLCRLNLLSGFYEIRPESFAFPENVNAMFFEFLQL